MLTTERLHLKLTAQAPTRIDLAGATLDIHPLYLFQGGRFREAGLTVNAAIDLTTQAVLEESGERGIELRSLDLDRTLKVDSLEELDQLQGADSLPLLANIVRFYRPRPGFRLTTRSNVPPGSGLGGSSSLLIAVSSLLVQRENRPVSKRQMIDWAADVEARTLGIPTGKQDYYPAAFGGLAALHFNIGRERREALNPSPNFLRRLDQSLLLGYSGASRFSGANNWAMLKRGIDDRAEMEPLLQRIAETASRMRQALLDEDLPQAGECLAEEWENRRRLAEGVSTPQLEEIFAQAREAGAWGAKVCGAGGGGCFVVLCPPERRALVGEAICRDGVRLLDPGLRGHGVRVWLEA
ncbi:MAG TPA: hypothetical protein VLV83_02550 [Acidobacteriota bacterium]|nr:hypothetical protein [Acidobacteriota bacterium]